MARLRAIQCLLSRVVRQYGPHPTSDLLGVDYYHTVPADTEFPRRLGTLDLIVRFTGDGPFSGGVRVAVTRLHPDGSDRDRVYWKSFGLVPVTAPGPFVLDYGFKLHDVVVPGEALYAVRVVRRGSRRWDGSRPWRVLGTDYFLVARAA